MEVQKEENDSDVVTLLSDYSDYRYWTTNYDYEEYEIEETFEEDEEYVEEEEKELDDIDIFAEIMMGIRDKRSAKLAAEAEAKREQLRKLIGVKVRGDVSEDTIITPDEVLTPVTVVSSAESSIHPCLRDIDISDSQLKLQNLYTMFPVPDDPGLIPAFWTILEGRVNYEDDGIMKFYDLAKASNIPPIRVIKDMLLSNTVNLKYYGLDQRIIRPLCEALMKNVFVQTVNLTGNWLSDDACYHLNDLLLKNSTVHTLLLEGCRIGPTGAKKLQDGISSNTTLVTLDLSDCNIQSEGLAHITPALCDNASLENLSLRHNNLDEFSADSLPKLVSGSKTLKRLNLSWNSLYSSKLWRKFGRSLENNTVLIDLDLSWNGLGSDCVMFLRRYLSLEDAPLKTIRLDGNQFRDEEANILSTALMRNTMLEEVYLGNNPMKAAGALALIQALTPERSPESQVRVLDLTNVWAAKDSLESLEIIDNTRPWLKIKLGGILSNYKTKGPDMPAILFNRANFEAMEQKQKRDRRNFGHFILTLGDELISRSKFGERVTNFRLILSSTLITELTSLFSGRGNTVNQAAMKAAYMKLFPDTRPPPPKKAGRKKGGKKKKAAKEE